MGSNNGGDWNKWILMLAFGATILWLIWATFFNQVLDTGRGIGPLYERQSSHRSRGR